MTTEESLRTEAEARRALATRRETGQHPDTIVRYLAAADYSERRRAERDEDEEARESGKASG